MSDTLVNNNRVKIEKAKPIIWTISGADCSGGAGIAADIKTGHGLGVEVCPLMTANTVQNSHQLLAVNPVSIDILQQQVEALVIDKPPAVIKVGLLVNLEQLHWLCQVLTKLKHEYPALKVVYDPVGQASVGGSLSTLNVKDLNPLFALIDIITPNLVEAKQLAQSDSFEIRVFANAISRLGAKSIIIKGGHSDEQNNRQENSQCHDYCFDYNLENPEADEQPPLIYQLSSPRLNSRYSHGGGCSFASALAAFIAQGYLLRDAFTLSKAFINQGLAANVLTSRMAAGETAYYGAFEQLGWPNQSYYFPEVIDANEQKQGQGLAFKSLGIKRGETKKLGLYPVVDSLEWLRRLLPLNLNIIQLRLKSTAEKPLSADDIETMIVAAIKLSHQYKTRLFINDYWQLAIKHGAYGVHIGQEDLQQADLVAIKQADLSLGISTHGCYEFLLAQQLQPSYLAIGAIFPTKTKDMTGQIQGIANLSQILTLSSDIPVVAIGGINHQRAKKVWQTGVDSIAVVTAITEAENYIQSVAAFQQLIKD